MPRDHDACLKVKKVHGYEGQDRKPSSMSEVMVSQTFEEFMLRYTGRDMEYHRRYETAQMDFMRLLWDCAKRVGRESRD